MLHALDLVGNPSSIHHEGRETRRLVEEARSAVAALAGGEAENVVFTSGATEALNALVGEGLSGCCGRDLACALPVLAGATEHAAVHEMVGLTAPRIGVDPSGLIRLDQLETQLSIEGPALVIIQLANNETGVIQPITEIARIVHAAGGALAVDAVQAPGRISVNIAALGADALVFSGHKMGGPKGVGAILFSDHRTRLAKPAIAGGGQERGQRGGTENVAGIAGMGAAARAIRDGADATTNLLGLRQFFEGELSRLVPDVVIFGANAPRLPNTSAFAIPGIAADKALIALDLAGIALSSGSACSSGKVRASHVLAAMGVPDWARLGALRLSVGASTTQQDIERAIECLVRLAVRRPQPISAVTSGSRHPDAA
jgi:cysteine desulfurase